METGLEIFTVICAWCNRILNCDDPDESIINQRLTHSICECCFEKMCHEIASMQSQTSPTNQSSKELSA